MTEAVLIPTIEKRVASLLEYNRRRDLEANQKSRSRKPGPTITLSREYGCEAYPTAQLLQGMCEETTGHAWVIVDRVLLEEIARNNNLSDELLKHQGEKNLFLDEMLATFSPHWKSERDSFSLLSQHIMALAGTGNVIIVGQASAFIARALGTCFHFRLFASAEFKNRVVRKRLGVSEEEAEKLIAQRQKRRDRFIRDFVDRDPHDMGVYNLIFNNSLNSPSKMAHTIVEYVFGS